jgi:superoxide dismutase, Fe-Mn family
MKKADVQQLIRKSLGFDESEANLKEAYAAQEKTYDLNTDLLLSKTKEQHKELYAGYVEALNVSSAQLDTVDRRSAGSTSDFRSIKLNEQYNMNATYLHELYFANISDPYSEIGIDSLAHMRLNRDFGTFDDWQMDFRACAMACHNGWAVTAYNTYLKRYMNFLIDGHDCHVPVGIYPIIVLDMWEHARRDYLNRKNDYIRAMMKELNWNVIEERVKRSEIIAQALSSGGKGTWT